MTTPKSLGSVSLDPASLGSESLDIELVDPVSLEIELVDPVSVDPASVDLAALQAGAAAASGATAGPSPAGPTAAAAKTAKRRAGVPVWRTGKPDAFLAASVDTARTALEGITAASDIGQHLAAKSEGDRLVTHLFDCRLPGYAGWQWFAVLTRNSRSKVVTVNELGLLPSEDSILAPEWVPWAERVRPEDEQEQESGEHEAREPEAGAHEAAALRDRAPEAGADQADAPVAAATEPADGVAASLDAAGLDGETHEGGTQQGEARDAEAGESPEQRFTHDAGTD
ncbi:DUF3027 domain-containing protein [Arthrobacter sp. Z4-13]